MRLATFLFLMLMGCSLLSINAAAADGSGSPLFPKEVVTFPVALKVVVSGRGGYKPSVSVKHSGATIEPGIPSVIDQDTTLYTRITFNSPTNSPQILLTASPGNSCVVVFNLYSNKLEVGTMISSNKIWCDVSQSGSSYTVTPRLCGKAGYECLM
mgnify:CR=1 FL=1